ncbi:FAD-dependent oxidoreductase [Halovenus rubra]|uniref:FAD-dependent oxidoreductase n=2 Tax=Halovenus rubra TaxID=869890 RepID=A0ACC7E231_9EURY|nr:FAD-dependent oxidoreductase [Halovenus rubra]
MEETPAEVNEVRDVGPDAIALDIESPDDFDAAPGQFIKVTLTVDGDEESRFYTISSPSVEDTFEMTVGIDSDGEVSPQLRALSAGDELVLSGPYGNAYYEEEDQVCLIAGGPGIGPSVGIAERALTDGGEAAVVYRDDDPIHRERLETLTADGGDVRVLDSESSLSTAVRASLDTLSGDIETTQVFVYGFAEFLDDAMDAIERAGGEPDGAKVENFG